MWKSARVWRWVRALPASTSLAIPGRTAHITHARSHASRQISHPYSPNSSCSLSRSSS
jgi:hypothetical protein